MTEEKVLSIPKLYPDKIGFWFGLLLCLLITGGIVLTLYGLAQIENAEAEFGDMAWVLYGMPLLLCWFAYECWTNLIGWYAILPHVRLRIQGGDISAPDQIFKIDDVTDLEIGIRVVKKSLNLVPAGKGYDALGIISFNRGGSLRVRAGEGPFKSFALKRPAGGKTDVERLLTMFNVLASQTGKQVRGRPFDELMARPVRQLQVAATEM